MELNAGMARLRRSMALTSGEVAGLSRGIESGLRGALDGLVLDGKRLSDVLRGLGQQMAATVFRTSTQPVIQAASGALASGIEGVTSRVLPFARGGVVSGPVRFPMRGATGLMGEAGPEAIMPLARGADGRLGVAAQTSARPVNVVFNINTPDVAGFRRSQSQIAAQMGRVLAHGARNS